MSENKIMIDILKDHIEENLTEIPEQLDILGITECAKRQNLEGIIFYQTKINALEKDYFATIFNYINRRKILNILLNELRQKKIEYFLVKGFIVSDLYPHPELRTMGDCDLVVHPEDKELVHEIMINLGFRCISKGKKEWNYKFRNMEFELHDHLLYKDEINSEKAVKFFDNVWEHVSDNSLEWNFHFLFLIYHLRKHIMGIGAGLRHFLDIAVVIKKVKINWNKVVQSIEYLEVSNFFNRVLGLLNDWFEIDVPGFSSEIEKEFLEKAEEKILCDGVFGFEDEKNLNHMYINIVHKKGKTFAIQNMFHDIFLPYKDMTNMEEYKFLKNRFYLLPYAWIYRIRLKWRNRGKIKKHYSASDKQIDARIEYLKQWGL